MEHADIMTQDTGATAERRFFDVDQRLFAALSGDTNPMHMDALAARRTQAGAPVVHGVHAVLWVLDQVARTTDLTALASIAVSMNRFTYLDQPVTWRATRPADDTMAVDILCDGVAVMAMRLKFGARKPAAGQDAFLAAAPANLGLATEAAEDLKDLQGWISPAAGADGMAAAFPALCQAIGEARAGGLALLSTLVGMACPGLHSIFTAFQADFLDGVAARPGIGFRVRIADPRFRVVRMAVGGAGLAATVSAFLRMPPMPIAGMAELAGWVRPDEFAGRRVLVVGGSRGLGALSARLIAAGGGQVVLTYARGEADAAAVVADIRAHRGEAACAMHQMDVSVELEPSLGGIGGVFTDLLYFATPQIRRQKAAIFVPALFYSFFHCYVLAFARLTAILLERGGEAALNVFYPSSVAVVERPEDMTEYAMAKAAGEVLAADLAAADPRLFVVVERLGRLPTDQNATVVQAEFADPVATMLPLLRRTLGGRAAG